jgi:hypothetical protein
MLRTVEATFDPQSGVHFMEPVLIKKPVRILVTFMESVEQSVMPLVQDKHRSIGYWLNCTKKCASARTPEEMDRYIQELRLSWE